MSSKCQSSMSPAREFIVQQLKLEPFESLRRCLLFLFFFFNQRQQVVNCDSRKTGERFTHLYPHLFRGVTGTSTHVAFHSVKSLCFLDFDSLISEAGIKCCLKLSMSDSRHQRLCNEKVCDTLMTLWHGFIDVNVWGGGHSYLCHLQCNLKCN